MKGGAKPRFFIKLDLIVESFFQSRKSEKAKIFIKSIFSVTSFNKD